MCVCVCVCICGISLVPRSHPPEECWEVWPGNEANVICMLQCLIYHIPGMPEHMKQPTHSTKLLTESPGSYKDMAQPD